MYKSGLDSTYNHLKKKEVDKQTHCSVVGKGCLENPRSKGGRSHYLIAAARKSTDILLRGNQEGVKVLVNKLDQFGQIIIDQYVYEYAYHKLKHEEFKREPTLGDILFVEIDEIDIQWRKALNEGQRVPLHLAHILNATASKLVTEIGTFSQKPRYSLDFMYFTKPVKYKLEKLIPCKADVSIEAGMKTRLTTGCLAGFQHLSQLPANAMRGLLSKDSFNRVGFQEADKLWEVLKSYKKASKKAQKK